MLTGPYINTRQRVSFKEEALERASYNRKFRLATVLALRGQPADPVQRVWRLHDRCVQPTLRLLQFRQLKAAAALFECSRWSDRALDRQNGSEPERRLRVRLREAPFWRVEKHQIFFRNVSRFPAAAAVHFHNFYKSSSSSIRAQCRVDI